MPATPRNTTVLFLSQVQASGMNVALKNANDIIEYLVDCFDFAVNESCNQCDECEVS
ncbi:unnamed protein product, partial [Laminaria digitata]